MKLLMKVLWFPYVRMNLYIALAASPFENLKISTPRALERREKSNGKFQGRGRRVNTLSIVLEINNNNKKTLIE